MTRLRSPFIYGRFFAILLLLAATPAYAHYPYCTCAMEGGRIACKGGFSDGTGAEGVTLDVISYDEEILVPGKFGADSVVRFDRPAGEFYVLFDAGPGHVVEVDWRDIDGLAP